MAYTRHRVDGCFLKTLEGRERTKYTWIIFFLLSESVLGVEFLHGLLMEVNCSMDVLVSSAVKETVINTLIVSSWRRYFLLLDDPKPSFLLFHLKLQTKGNNTSEFERRLYVCYYALKCNKRPASYLHMNHERTNEFCFKNLYSCRTLYFCASSGSKHGNHLIL